MTTVIQNLGWFFIFALIAMFVQNAVFTRGFGVSRLVKLVEDSTMDSVIFCALLCLVQIISAPLAYFLNRKLSEPEFWFREYVRPLGLIICAIIAFLIVMAILTLLNPRNKKDMLAVLPMASFNCAVLGPMLISSTQSHSFVQSIGFALGSGLGYGIAVLLVSEGRRRTATSKIPSALKGLPIKLIYIGILALSIYGLTGHRIAI